jgi:hypothetical protein
MLTTKKTGNNNNVFKISVSLSTMENHTLDCIRCFLRVLYTTHALFTSLTRTEV